MERINGLGEGPQASEHEVATLGDFLFESGEIVDNFKVSYVTHGKLNENRDNVILAMHSNWGDHHDFDFLVGPGKALDTDEYFIVSTDMLGNASIRQDTTTGPTNSGLKMAFPRYTIRDSVNVEHELLKEYLGFDQILAVIGISGGGMKAYQFGVSYPSYVKGLIPIAGTPATSPQTRTMLRNWMDILELDSGWYAGNYETNPTVAANTVAWNGITWLYTPAWFATHLKTEEAYGQWKRIMHEYLHSNQQEARDKYYSYEAWADFNIGDAPGFNGDVEAALKSIQAQVLIIGAKGDMLFNREGNILAETAIPKANYVEIETPWGHAFCVGWDSDASKIMEREIGKFLSNLATGVQ